MRHERLVVAGVGNLVGRAAFLADRAVAALGLEDVSLEFRQDGGNLLGEARGRHRASAGLLAVDVVRVRHKPQLHRAFVGTVRRHQVVGELVGIADDEDEKPRGHRIQRTAVADLDEIEIALHRLDDGSEGNARGLVNQEEPVEVLKHSELSQVRHRLSQEEAYSGSPGPRRPSQARDRA